MKKGARTIYAVVLSVLLFCFVLCGCGGEKNSDPLGGDVGNIGNVADGEGGGDEGAEESGELKITPADLGDNVDFHTALQQSYLSGDYNGIGKYAAGEAELSFPRAVNLKWKVSGNAKNVTHYTVEIGEEADLSDARVYTAAGASYPVYNLYLNTRYYWRVTANVAGGDPLVTEIKSFKTSDVAPRNIFIDGVANARDLGGWKTANGGRIRQGLVYRTGRLNKSKMPDVAPEITEYGIATMRDVLGIKTEIDLRKDYEREESLLRRSLLGDEVNFYRCPMEYGQSNPLDGNGEMIARVFGLFADESNYPLFFHCDIGTDRTGLIAYLLNGLLGVSEEDLLREYLFSNFGRIGSSRDVSRIAAKYTDRIKAYEGATLAEKIENALKSLGVTEEQIESIRSILLGDETTADGAAAISLSASGETESAAESPKTIVEGESAVLFGNGSKEEDSSPCSGGKRLAGMSATAGAYAEYEFDFDEDCTAQMSVKAAYVKSAVDMSDVMAIEVNGESLDLSDKPVSKTCSDYGTYNEFPLGGVTLKNGVNTMRVSSVGGSFTVDYFAFKKASANYVGETMRLEAENAAVAGNGYPVEREEASGGAALGSLSSGEKIALKVRSDLNASALLSVKVRYWGSAREIDDLITSLRVNGKKVNLGNIALYSDENASRTYQLGTVQLRRGLNSIIVTSGSDKKVEYDWFEIEEKVLKYDGAEKKYSAADAAAVDGCRKVRLSDSLTYIADSSGTTSVSYVIESDRAAAASLTVSLGNMSGKTNLGDILFIVVNGCLLDLSETAVQRSAAIINFRQCGVGKVMLLEGGNTIVIHSLSGKQYLESISLK